MSDVALVQIDDKISTIVSFYDKAIIIIAFIYIVKCYTECIPCILNFVGPQAHFQVINACKPIQITLNDS